MPLSIFKTSKALPPIGESIIGNVRVYPLLLVAIANT
jgi:hypothetical protein